MGCERLTVIMYLPTVTTDHCDQIGQFFYLWATF